MEINEAERKKDLKEMKKNLENSGTMVNAPTIESSASQKKKAKRKAMRKYLRK